MKNYILTFLLAVLVVLAATTLRKNLVASMGVAPSPYSPVGMAIGGSPIPFPPKNAERMIGGSPIPFPPKNMGKMIGGSPIPFPPKRVAQ